MRTSECEAHEKYGLYYSYPSLPVSVLFSADFFYFAEKGWNTHSLFLSEDRFNRLPVVSYPARSIRTQLVRLFRTKSNKVCFIS